MSSLRLYQNVNMVYSNEGGSGQQVLWSIGQLTSMISGEGLGYGCILELIHILVDSHGSRSGGVIGTLVYW